MPKKITDNISFADIFNTVYGWIAFLTINLIQFIFTIPIVIISLITFDKDRRLITYMTKFFTFAFFYTFLTYRIRIETNGVKPPKKGERRIYVVNHSSIFDVIMMLALPGCIKSLMKAYYTKLPLIGFFATISGHVVLKDDSDSTDYMDTLEKLGAKIERGNPLVIYPEGTRSRDGKIGKFYGGAFKIALDTKSDIVPVVFDSWNAIRPGAYWIRDTKPHIRILDPIPYNSIKDLSYRKLATMTRTIILDGLVNLRNSRRLNEPNYYRHCDKFVLIDKEMEAELNELKSKTSNS